MLAELSPCRNNIGMATVRKVAALEPGLVLGSCLCFQSAPSPAQLAGRRKSLIAEAYKAAEADVACRRVPPAAVEHHLARMGCANIGATVAELKRRPAETELEPTSLDIRWLTVSRSPPQVLRATIAHANLGRRPSTATGHGGGRARQRASRRSLRSTKAAGCSCAGGLPLRGTEDFRAEPPRSSRPPASATASARSW